MKNVLHVFIIVCVMIFCLACEKQKLGDVQSVPFKSVKIVADTTNIPVAFSSSNAASHIMTGLFGYTHISILNNTTCILVLNTNYDATAPSNDNNTNIYLLGNTITPGAVFDGPYIGPGVYMRTDDGAACTSGTVYVQVW